MASLFVFSFVILGLFAAAFWLSRPKGGRDRRDGGSDRLDGGLPVPTAPLPVEAQQYLSQLDIALGLPAEIRAEIRAELGDHLQDSIAAIEAEGLDRDRAIREALARLGRPAELARQLRHAHQTTRRLLAGAAGGVFQAGLGLVAGYIGSLFIFIVVVMLLGTILRPPLDFLAQRLPDWPPAVQALFTAAVPLALMSLLPAFLAGRWSVRALMRGSRRSPAQIARWWALGGTLAVAWFVVFGLTAEQSWLAVPLELLIAVAFAAGALWRTQRTLFLTRWRVPVALMAVAALVLPFVVFAAGSVSSGGDTWSTDYSQENLAFDRVAPAWPGNLSGSSWGGSYSTWSTNNAQVIELGWDFTDKAVLASFRDLRIEAWRAVQFRGTPDWVEDFVPAPGYDAPYATEPATLGSPYATDGEGFTATDGGGFTASDGAGFTARFDMGHARTTRWAVFLTGIAPDGIRYRLEPPATVRTSFSGTIWDWLTASE